MTIIVELKHIKKGQTHSGEQIFFCVFLNVHEWSAAFNTRRAVWSNSLPTKTW